MLCPSLTTNLIDDLREHDHHCSPDAGLVLVCPFYREENRGLKQMKLSGSTGGKGSSCLALGSQEL